MNVSLLDHEILVLYLYREAFQYLSDNFLAEFTGGKRGANNHNFPN